MSTSDLDVSVILLDSAVDTLLPLSSWNTSSKESVVEFMNLNCKFRRGSSKLPLLGWWMEEFLD